MKLVFIGDLQTHAWTAYGSVTPEGLNERLLDTIRELERILHACILEGVKHVFILGDVFQERGKLDIVVLNSLYRTINRFRESSIDVYLLLGNHDRYPVGDYHSLEVFRPICKVIDQPATLKVGEISIYAIPYIPDQEKLRQLVADTPTKTDILIGHFAVKELKLPHGKIWGEGVSLAALPDRAFTFLGHYHRFTKLQGKKRAYYIGSLLQIDWGDFNIRKYYVVYDHETKSIQKRESFGPRFLHIRHRGDSVDRNIRALVKGNFVFVELISEISDVGRIKKQYEDLGARYVEIELRSLDKEVVIETKRSIDNLLEDYVRKSNISLSKGSLIELGKGWLREAKDGTSD